MILNSSSDDDENDLQTQLQRQSQFCGEDDPSVDEKQHDTYDELSESD